MAIDKRIPIYRFVVGEDDDAGVTAVALVDNPAIEMNWQAFAASKISFDFDDTLSTARGQELAQQLIDKGAIIYVISARQDVQGMLKIAKDLGIPESRVFATGSNKAKIEKVKSLGITKHYDNNADVIKELGSIGSKFAMDKITCSNCGHTWMVSDGGEDPYKCNMCGMENQFIVEPKDNESEDEFISRCIAVEVGNGYEQEQAAAMCYSKWNDQKISKFSSNKEKRIVSGPLMVSNLPIYRKDEQGEYYGLFTAEDIYNIRNKFFKNNNTKSVNEMHDPNKMVDGVYMIESFIIDSKRGINAPDGLKLTDGSWFGSYKVDNEEIWNDFIKTGEFKGFSVEGVFKTTKIDTKPLSIIEQAIDIIKQIED